MNKEAAKKLIRDTFEHPFDRDQFVNFTKNLLNRMEEAPFTYRGNYIFADFQDYVESLERIGKFEDAAANRLDILIVHLKKSTSLERARSAQRKFVAKYLKGSRGGELKDAALVAFVSPDEQDWRFSFVKMDYTIDPEKGKVVEEFTPAKRYSFLVGKNENSHTAQSRLLPILEDTNVNPTISQIEDAFGIERVTKEFFEQYRELYHCVEDALAKLVKKDKDIAADFQEKGVDPVDFAKKLLGQIVFLYFLQKKGWFGVKRKAAWGTGSKVFLRELFRGEHGKYKNFFNEILEPLFYNTLAVERSENYSDRFDCKIPFLNGGLFDPLNNYDWVNTDILIPNDIFSNSHKTKQGDIGTGILDVFDRYNFTVKEDEPLEKEVAVDPEMLGKVFENLLEVKDRKSKGTYYTPREIVHYMCQESLICYVETALQGVVAREEIEILVRHGESALENDALVNERGAERGKYKYKIPESIRERAEEIDKSLSTLKVCDPAVGSGAFLVGMMTEIIRMRVVLTEFMSTKSGRDAYELKRHAIQSSLYGVDVDLGAVEIAKLRLWLSLIVDEDDYRQIKPLPNLDYKVMQGNSLLEEFEGIKLIDERFFEKQEERTIVRQRLEAEQSRIQREYILLNANGQLGRVVKAEFEKRLKEIGRTLRELERPQTLGQDDLGLYGPSEVRTSAEKLLQLHEAYLTAYNKRQKDQYRKEIDILTWKLIEATLNQQGKSAQIEDVRRFQQTNTRPFFIWKLNFADVFASDSGFDIIIANPPYISHDKLTDKAALKRAYKSYEPFADVYCYFIELGVRLLKPGGMLSFITSNSYLRATYGRPLRNLLSMNGDKRVLINIEDSQVFEAAIVNAAVILYQFRGANTGSSGKCKVVNMPLKDLAAFDRFVAENSFELDQEDLSDAAWTLVPSEWIKLRGKIRGAGPTLESMDTKIRLGLATGANEVFVIDDSVRKTLIAADRKNDQVIKPCLRGRDIFRYSYRQPERYLLLTRNGIDVPKQYPTLIDYFKQFGKKFRERGAKGQHWSNLRACAFFDDFSKEKIIWIELTDQPRFALCTEEYYLLNSAYFLLPPDGADAAYLLGLLNSKLMTFYLSMLAATSGMGTLRWINEYVKEFPIPVGKSIDQSRIGDIVKEIMRRKQQGREIDTSMLESTIDDLVYKLYGLTNQEIAIIENGS